MRHLPVALLLALTLASTACDRDNGDPAPADQPDLAATILDAGQPWGEGVPAVLEELIATRGNTSPGYDTAHPPVAVFDWDNTVIKNDIGEATFHWFLLHDVYFAPPGGDWGRTSGFLTAEAREALSRACDEIDADGTLVTSRNRNCAAEMLAIYGDHKTAGGDPAWIGEGYDPRAFEPAYAWLAQLLAGHTPGEVRDGARGAIDAYLAASEGETREVAGRDGLVGYVRVYEPMRDLIAAMKTHGFDVWIVSASPELVVQMFAERVGVEWDHVVGIRSLVDADGRLTTDLAGCGPVQDGDHRVIPYIDGKRCWIDKAIFGGEGRLDPHPDATHRPVFAAGDAVTDISMLHDATELRLVLDRHEPEVLCHALAGTAGTWLIQPMFLDPAPARAEPYPCATAACRDDTGQPAPCLDPAGKLILDQIGPPPGP